MAINPISFPMPQAFSGGADFAPLANLGNVYRQGQQNRLADLAFQQMGTDPAANAQLLIKSGHPDLVPLGVRMQQALDLQREHQREFGITSQREQESLELERQKFEQGKPQTSQQRYDLLKSQVDAGRLPADYLDRPEVQAHIATGQPLPGASIVAPQTAMDRKAIRDADLQAESIGQSINQLDELRGNMKKALHLGPLTGTAGYIASFMPEGYGKEVGTATELATNEALRSMIGNIKSSFGSNPSNKEDAWLLKAQASVDKAPDVQDQILKEGRELLVERQRFARDQAKELREGTYYGKGHVTAVPEPAAAASGGTGGGTALKAAPDRILNKAKAAIAQGADRKQVRQHLIDNGYDASGI